MSACKVLVPLAKETVEHICNEVSNGTVLTEIGSAPYKVTQCLMEKGFEVRPLDKNPSMYSDLVEEMEVDVKGCDIERDKLPYKDSSQEVVLFMEVLEHMRINPIEVFTEINRVLKEGGRLFLSTPNFYSIFNIYGIIVGRGLLNQWGAYEAFKQLGEKGYPGHVRVYNATEIRRLLERTGFEVEKIMYNNASVSGKPDKIAKVATFFLPKLSDHLFVWAIKKEE